MLEPAFVTFVPAAVFPPPTPEPRMRSTMTQFARLLAVSIGVAACSPGSRTPPPHGQASINVNVTCGNPITLSVNPATVHFTHPGNGGAPAPTDVVWSLDGNAGVNDVTIAALAPGNWPFASGNGQAGKGRPFKGVGNPTQAVGQHRYSVTVSCPGAPTVIFDPDIWVD